ncbi:MAG: hypothetical protein GX805_10955 [Gammaproteobacteria bacterium]|nr:hypothetical protein [Gammaproteobacteria bacterium]
MAGCVALAVPPAVRAQQAALTVRPLAEGLQRPHGVAIHPQTGDIYVSERGSGRIVVLRNGRPEPALAPGWTVSEDLPRWAISDSMPLSAWMSPALNQPGPIAFSTNGTLFVAEQTPQGRILEFRPDVQGLYTQAIAVPVPWLDQEFQWRDLQVDALNRLFIAGADEVGSDFMKFGSALVREANGDWWEIDFGPFANFGPFALSAREDVMVLGDRNRGKLSWWEVHRHIMLGGVPDSTGRAELQALALYPDGAFIIGQLDAPGQAVLKRLDPFNFQQTTLATGFRSIGDIAMDRPNVRYYVTDPEAGKVLECTLPASVRFNEVAMRQIVRAVDGMMGMTEEAPAFLGNFFEQLQSAAQDLLPEDSTHTIQFNLSDIAGKMPIVAGRIRAAVEVAGAEEDPIEQVEFFLLFPSKVVMTDVAVSPSMSFFSARRKSGKVEQTKPLFQGDVGVYRLSGTNVSRVASAPGGLHIPIVVCGLDEADGGIYVNLSFLGAGIYGDYYLTLFQGPREQTAKLVVKSPTSESGNITYEASFMDEATIEGMDGSVTREQVSNLLVAGFGAGGGVNRSVGWLRLGQFPAAMTVSFGDVGDTTLTGAASGMRDIVEQKRVEMSLDAASEIQGQEPEIVPGAGGETEAPAPDAAPAGETAL